MLQNWELKNYKCSKIGIWKLLKKENKKFKQIIARKKIMNCFGLFTLINCKDRIDFTVVKFSQH